MRYARFGGEEVTGRRLKVLRRAARLGRSLLWPALGALLATVLATTARLLGPLAMRSGIDHGIAADDRGAITAAALVFLGLLVLQYIAQRIAQFSVAWVGERYLLDLRSRVFSHLIRLHMGFFDKSKTGVLVSRMTSDVESITQFVDEGAVMLLTNVLTAGGVAVAMLLVDVRLALTVFSVIVLLVAMSVVFQRYASRAYRQIRERIGVVLGMLQEGIAGVREVQAFTHEGEQAGSFGRSNERYFEANMAAARAISWYFPGVAFLRVLGTALVLVFGGRRVISGDLTFGSLVVFLLYLDWFFQPIINLANVYNLMQAAIAGLAKLFGILDTVPAIAESPVAVPLPAPEGRVSLEDVGFAYEPGRPVLEHVDLDVPPGQRLAVVGETGAGKSTIAKLVMRFYDPTSGRVALDGVDLRDLAFPARSSAVGLIPQDGFLFDGTLRDNLRYAVPGATEEDIGRVVTAMGIADWIEGLPEGLDTEVRERGTRFSAGERQLIALARAFLADPAVIVLDEATSNLDPGTEARVERALAVLLADRTSIVIAHRLRSAERADRVVMIDAGRVVADGTHDELAATHPGYGRLVEVWSRGVLS
jgi:ABC-type multidrug transport system fused ATPase/permease subunit